MITRRYVRCGGAAFLAAAAASGKEISFVPERPGNLPLGLIDLNAFDDSPPGICGTAIARLEVLEPSLLQQLDPSGFLAILAPASATVLTEVLRFERGARIVVLPKTILNIAILQRMVPEADIVHVEIRAGSHLSRRDWRRSPRYSGDA